MPENKGALRRYKILDQLLQRSKRCRWTKDDLLEHLNDRLREEYGDGATISRRMMEYDINNMRAEYGDSIEIVPDYLDVPSNDGRKTVKKSWIYYSDSSSSIFVTPMNDDEKYLLDQALSLVGQFDGLPGLEALDQLKKRMKTPENRDVISLERNCIETKNFFGELFSAICNQCVVCLTHFRFDRPDEEIKLIVHPYQLREYNNRWYLIGRVETDNGLEDEVWPFRLDSVLKVDVMAGKTYMPCNVDLEEEHFGEIIGVTYVPTNPLNKILFWVSDFSKGYVDSKPLHSSQVGIKNDEELRSQYPNLAGGRFYRIECRMNYELIRELSSYGPSLVVLSPDEVRTAIRQRAEAMLKCYSE